MKTNDYQPEPGTTWSTTPPSENDLFLSDPPPTTLAGYPGSKGAGGLAERIIRQMPPHAVYIEAFAGHAAVFRKKRSATINILYDADATVIARLERFYSGPRSRVVIEHADALEAIRRTPFIGNPDTLLYCDPPYLMEVRTRLLYDHEFGKIEEHAKLLALLKTLTCMVMVSGYRSRFYDRCLKRWRRVDIEAMTRGGMRTECVWCNFPEPERLHDPRFAGGDYRERERIKKKVARWRSKFQAMQPRERQCIAEALAHVDRSSIDLALSAGTTVSAENAGSGGEDVGSCDSAANGGDA